VQLEFHARALLAVHRPLPKPSLYSDMYALPLLLGPCSAFSKGTSAPIGRTGSQVQSESNCQNNRMAPNSRQSADGVPASKGDSGQYLVWIADAIVIRAIPRPWSQSGPHSGMSMNSTVAGIDIVTAFS